jgi:hypothetical protein
MPSASAPELPEARAAGPSRIRVWLRLALGATILAAVAIWVFREGDYLRNLSLKVLAVSTAASLFTVILNGLTLQTVAATYGRKLGFGDGLRISAFASIGNAAGGLPLGTALKFNVLNERVGLRLSEIAAGMGALTVGISLFLMLFAAVSVACREVPAVAKILALVAWAAAVTVIGVVGAYAARHHRLSALVAPFAEPRHVARCAALSFVVATSFVLNACATGFFLLPQASLNDLVFLSSAGILLGLLSFLQGVAGVQELSMALMAFTIGVDAAGGAQIALTLRATAMVAAALVLLGQLVSRTPRGRDGPRS